MDLKRVIATLLLLSISLLAQTTAPDPQTKPKTRKRAATPSASNVNAELLNEVRQLRQRVDNQDQKILSLQQAVQSRDQQIANLQNAANQARSSADAAASSSSQNAQEVSALQSTVNDIKLNNTNMAASMQEEQKRVGEMIESPLAIHYKGITITPGGFLAAETVWRQHATASDVNTPFTSIPFPGNDANHLSEFFGSGRQSRISLLAEGKISNAKLSGYYETDWLSAGVTSNNNQSNSYTNRMRQLYGQVALNSGWTFTGGQMWSLVTETKKGLDNRTEALPMTIDAQYHVGFSWMRQYGFRVVKSFGNILWLGASVENAQTTNLGGGNFPNNFLIGAPGANGGLYNGGAAISGNAGVSPNANYSFNYTPDFIVKAAFEPGFGHYEVFGIVSNFRDRLYPNAAGILAGTVVCGVTEPAPAGTPNCTSVRTGGGGGANARWSFLQKRVDFGLHFLGGDGVGRYGSSQLAEVTAHPNGTLALIRNYQALETLEWHSKHWDVYTNVGAEYAQRTAYLNVAGAFVGYGRPDQTGTGACLIEPNPAATSNGPSSTKNGFNPTSNGCNDVRNIIEGTFGFWYKAYNGPKGRIQFGPQYSYMTINTWWNSSRLNNVAANGSAPTPHTIENMFFTSFRYYLP